MSLRGLARSLSALSLVATFVMAPGAAANAGNAAGGLGEVAQRMTEAGYPVETTSEARQLLRNAGIGVDDAIALLRDNPNNADLIAPLVFEVVGSELETSVNGTNSTQVPSSAESVDQAVALASTDICGWAISNVNIKGGASGWVIAKMGLRTDWCWNSSKTKIVGTPVESPPTSSVTVYGWSIGATWTESPKVNVDKWLTSGWKYRIATTSTFKLCPLHIDLGCTFHSNPWMIHDMYGNGTVGKSAGY